MQDFEKLGAFYLGRVWDPQRGATKDDLLLYDSKDLTTHAVCVGMTGSGKTGLCTALLEEAAIDGIPAIAVDPKGDLGNLMLTFPDLLPHDFRPWIDDAEAARRGLTPDDFAALTAQTWKKGLADWGQDGARIARLRAAADVTVYTPGSGAGLPLSVFDSFAAPPAAVLEDADALRERIAGAVSGVLALLSIDADPIKSREHILLSTLLDRAWRAGRRADLPSLIREIQRPPFEMIGVLDLESFYPAKDRAELAMGLNGLLASPGFAAWMEGEPLDVKRLLWTPEGKPRLSVISIAHLSDSERMFFVTLLLHQIVGWMRAQPGTSSLRALLYMDEIFGFFPPTANPPSKMPMLTLLKQARAFGLGVVLATQNPVDLDYKGLSNAGTWFLGRLQTERDKARVLEGLEGASSAAGASFDRQKMEATLAGLGNRVFLMNNVHEDAPVLFQSRWALSYLRGPLTKTQIQTLMAPRKSAAAAARPSPAVPGAAAPTSPRPTAVEPSVAPVSPASERPVAPPEAQESFVACRGSIPEGSSLVYRPALLASARVHFASAKAGLDTWEELALLAPIEDAGPGDPWDAAQTLESALDLEMEPDPRAVFAALPVTAGRAKSYASWSKGLAEYLYRTRITTLRTSKALKLTSRPGETEGDFRARLTLTVREGRDAGVEALRKAYAPRLAGLEERIRRAEERVAREQSQYQQQSVQTAISVGATVLGALFGRKIASTGTIGRATTAARGAGRAIKERGEIGAARESVEDLRQKLAEMEEEFQAEVVKTEVATDPASVPLETVEVRPKKTDVSVTRLSLVWTPWRIGKDGKAEASFS